MAVTVREMRKARFWTQSELARRANVAVQTVHRIEEGRSVLPITAEAISRALSVPAEELSDLRVAKRVK